MEDKYKLKVEKLGCGAERVQELWILNKVVRATKRLIELEADPRHAELVVKELGLETAKISVVLGFKEEAKRSSGPPSSSAWRLRRPST